ncbi:MBL fold metallo-hydrolase [Paenibacillus graminis]|uniref:MBL fold metallo-hydrolase n=1 Tax=Paenibacillus graminis TaxID=189425 RepID=UPI002DC03FB3|nr:MBL fold metallo-hydrolase [Paenibacillus graminis]MEC0169396.1 MBL fold metallo-hydrolase [Paenibacillus graminis]
MYIAKGIEMLEISVPVMGGTDTFYPALIWDEEEAVLVDTGVPGSAQKFKEAAAAASVPWNLERTILITHQDIDHIGSLPALLEQSESEITVLAHELERPYIEGDKMLLKHTPEALAAAEAMLPQNISEEWKRAFLHVLAHPPKGRVDQTLLGGELLPIAGGITVIHTPGHSPGHLSLYHQASRTLIAADALTVRGGELCGPDAAATPDMAGALRSLHKFADFEIDQVICYHGGLFRGGVNRRIAELAQGGN